MLGSVWLATGLTLATAAAQAASDPADPAMLKLASKSGCLTCHHVEAGSQRANDPLPIGPAWADVAARYAGVADASVQLTRTVLAGSNPYASHWKGKANGLAMPPNAVAINEQDTRVLVAWILALPAPRASSAPAQAPATR
jgi:cytochrome c